MTIGDRRMRIPGCRTATAALLAGVVTTGCSKPVVEEVQTTAAAPVATIEVRPNVLEGVVVASGIVAPAPGGDQTVVAPEAARIADIPKAEGDRVKQGDLLVRFEIPARVAEVAAHRAEVQQAQARVENAQASVTRLTTLVDHGVAAAKDLEDAKRDLAEARGALALAQSAAEGAAALAGRSVVRARFAGIVARRAHNPGDMVEPTAADMVLRVIDPARLQVVAAVAIPDLARVQTGRPVRIIVPGSDEPQTGTVLTRPGSVDPAGITADVRIAFGAITRLASGTPVRVEIVAEQHPGVLAVPLAAVLHEGEDAYVMLAGSDSKAHKRKVTLGLTTPALVEITGGLKAGESVIVQGQQGLPDGAGIVAAK
jgi:membrane fusion protein, multidrug efflux system